MEKVACTACWFSSRDDDEHCGECRCCPPSAALAPFGWITVQREGGRVRITQADETALISPVLIGQMFAGRAPYLRLDGDELVILDDFDAVVAYRIGEYVMDGGGHGFALRRQDRTRYESHAWSPRTDEDDDECVACGVTWQDCEGECPGVQP